eukprot:TRINITY_DN6485_c1_g1_i1.p1 TRINITY_DN6485_c1_g1~~TRINITY_DN6485_c1_g1_i1.p1  ORF type:complete len:356 (+),score=61.78 TRINITY_DN6485_c1_g1_i1:50-1069(+)
MTRGGHRKVSSSCWEQLENEVRGVQPKKRRVGQEFVENSGFIQIDYAANGGEYWAKEFGEEHMREFHLESGLTPEDLSLVKELMSPGKEDKGKNLLMEGITEGADLLSPATVRMVQWEKTETEDIQCEQKTGDKPESYLRLVFTLNGVKGLKFCWEEEDVNVKKTIDDSTLRHACRYTRVSQFVLGVRATWSKVEPSLYMYNKLPCKAQVKTILLSAIHFGLEEYFENDILGYYISDVVVPLALHWKGISPTSRSNPVRSVIRTYPPSFQRFDHHVFEDLEWVMEVLGIPRPSRGIVNSFFILLICMINSSTVLQEGQWQHHYSSSAYIPVHNAEDWGK